MQDEKPEMKLLNWHIGSTYGIMVICGSHGGNSGKRKSTAQSTLPCFHYCLQPEAVMPLLERSRALRRFSIYTGFPSYGQLHWCFQQLLAISSYIHNGRVVQFKAALSLTLWSCDPKRWDRTSLPDYVHACLAECSSALRTPLNVSGMMCAASLIFRMLSKASRGLRERLPGVLLWGVFLGGRRRP